MYFADPPPPLPGVVLSVVNGCLAFQTSLVFRGLAFIAIRNVLQIHSWSHCCMVYTVVYSMLRNLESYFELTIFYSEQSKFSLGCAFVDIILLKNYI